MEIESQHKSLKVNRKRVEVCRKAVESPVTINTIKTVDK